MNKLIMTNCYIGKKGIDLKFTPNGGKAVVTYSIAVPKEFSKEKGYDYFNCVTWGANAEWLANNAHRVKKIGVSGRLSTRNYDNKEGNKVYITEIITDHVEVQEWNNEQEPAQETSNNEGYVQVGDSEGEIPF